MATPADLGDGDREPGHHRRRPPEVFLTSQADNKLQTLAEAPRPDYHDIALDRGVTAQRPYTGGDVLPSTAWHPEFADVNNDGIDDLLVTKGNVDAEIDQASKDPTNLFIGRADGTFVEGAEDAGIVDFEKARGAAVVDLNLDGMLDLVVVHRRGNMTLWRNVGSGDAAQPEAMGHWIDVRLRSPHRTSTPSGRGSKWCGRPHHEREVTIGGGHTSGELGWCTPASGRRVKPRCACTGPTGASARG